MAGKKLWKDAAGNLLFDAAGNPVWCDDCPCDQTACVLEECFTGSNVLCTQDLPTCVVGSVFSRSEDGRCYVVTGTTTDTASCVPFTIGASYADCNSCSEPTDCCCYNPTDISGFNVVVTGIVAAVPTFPILGPCGCAGHNGTYFIPAGEPGQSPCDMNKAFDLTVCDNANLSSGLRLRAFVQVGGNGRCFLHVVVDSVVVHVPTGNTNAMDRASGSIDLGAENQTLCISGPHMIPVTVTPDPLFPNYVCSLDAITVTVEIV